MIQVIDDSFPLSPVQHGMLFHYLSGASTGVDIEQIVVEYPEMCDSASLHAAWKAELRRQPVLRTGFRWKSVPKPLQEIHSDVELEYALHDWSRRTDSENERSFEEFLRTDRLRGFELDAPPLLRVALFRFGPNQCRVLWTFHHILIDGRSFVTILQEVDDLYERIRQGQPAGAEPVDFSSYKAYVEGLGGSGHAGSGDFWRDYLKGFTATTPLPFDPEARVGGHNQRYGERERRLSIDASEALRALAQKSNTTLNTLFMGAWAILLSRYSGETDIVFGATKSGRRTSIAVGLFLNTVPVRIDTGHQRSVMDFLKDLRGRWLSFWAHEQTPLVQIKESSELPPSSALFDSLIVFENQRFDSVLAAESAGKWSARKCRLFEQTNYALSLLAYGDREIVYKLEYDARRYTAPSVARMMDHFECILEAMAEDPNAKLGALRVLTPEDQRRIVYDWNRTDSEYPRDIMVPEAIARTARAMPDRVAVTFGESQMSYVNLNRRAGRLAGYLRRQGIGPGALVGVHVERSIDMLVALLAVMKSGAGYVPLDPGFPADRLRFMAEDSALKALIAQKGADTALAPGALRVEIDGQWPDESCEDFPCPAAPGDLAYVLYTSGSTGKPKGVQISHQALANFSYSMLREPGLGAEDVVLGVTTISFDIAALELYLPLMTGAKLILAGQNAAVAPQQLANLIRSHGVTVMQATPATWQMLLDSGWQGKPGLKVLCGGEPLSRELATRLLELTGELWNMYGPTETTIWSLLRRIVPTDHAILIGRPIANTTIYILDESLNPVPPGVSGELYIGGEGVSIGYLNRQQLTQDRFIADPFRPGAGTIYKTGDLARFWPGGEVECLGRNDFQVKIRGFRIELGEIESALQEHPAVRQSVVAAHEDRVGKRLVGYIVAAGAERPAFADLKTFLAKRLPDYMVPGQFVFLDALPLTPNGKVNRLALPAPEAVSNSGDSYAAPRDQFERVLCQAWAEVLGLERVGIHDNFFDLGGHSLLAVQLVLQVEEILPGERLPLSALLDAPTVERFAARMRSPEASDRQFLVRIRPGREGRQAFFCVPGAGGSVLSLRPLAMAMPDDLPFYCLQAKGLDGSEPFRTVEETARAYVDELRTVQPRGPYQVGGASYGGLIAFEMARILDGLGEAVAIVVLLDTINYAFGRFMPRHELIFRNLAFYLRRTAFHARKLLSAPPAQWPLHVTGRLRALRQHATGLAKMAGSGSNQVPAVLKDTEIEGAAGTQLGEWLSRVREASIEAANIFVPKPYRGRAVVLRASNRIIEPYQDRYLGWGPVVLGGVEDFEIEGDHDSILDDPAVRQIAEKLNEKLLKIN